MEDRLHPPGSAEAEAAAASQELGIPTIVAARWIAEQLVELQPGVAVHHVREGIDKEAFAVADVLPPPAEDGPLRVLIVGEAQAPYDGVDASLAAVEAMEQRHSSTVLPRATARDAAARAAHYDAADVVVSCVRVAGMLTEPLEAFHRGATCVTTETTGHDEYVVDGRNGLVTSWDDDRGTARLLDLLAADRALLARLRAEALATARAWPSERDSGAALAAALRTIAAEAA